MVLCLHLSPLLLYLIQTKQVLCTYINNARQSHCTAIFLLKFVNKVTSVMRNLLVSDLNKIAQIIKVARESTERSTTTKILVWLTRANFKLEEGYLRQTTIGNLTPWSICNIGTRTWMKVDKRLVYYHFHYSVKRDSLRDIADCCSTEHKLFLKQCETRRLSLTQSIKSVLEMWDPLCSYLSSHPARCWQTRQSNDYWRPSEEKPDKSLVAASFQHPCSFQHV